MPASVTTEKFIEKAKEIHGDRYDYSKTLYIRAHEKVIITCLEHGDFEQTPDNHCRKKGCPSCKIKLLSSFQILHLIHSFNSILFIILCSFF